MRSALVQPAEDASAIFGSQGFKIRYQSCGKAVSWGDGNGQWEGRDPASSAFLWKERDSSRGNSSFSSHFWKAHLSSKINDLFSRGEKWHPWNKLGVKWFSYKMWNSLTKIQVWGLGVPWWLLRLLNDQASGSSTKHHSSLERLKVLRCQYKKRWRFAAYLRWLRMEWLS